MNKEPMSSTLWYQNKQIQGVQKQRMLFLLFKNEYQFITSEEIKELETAFVTTIVIEGIERELMMHDKNTR